MSDNPASSFGKFVPGFDFLQNLAKGATQGLPQIPQLSKWVAPTLDVEDLDKRIAELKAVQFWLDQNATALKATIQALEVQKMTLATLKGMNLSMSELANAFTLTPTDDAPPARPYRAAERAAERPAEPPPQAKAAARAQPDGGDAPAAQDPAAGAIDPLQWWGALTQQFQQIAATAMREAASKSAPEGAMPAAAGAPAKAAAAKRAPARKGARKSAS